MGRAALDTADASIVASDGELDVALVTPGGVPGVLDEPVVLTILAAVADGEHGVIERGAASGRVEYARLVSLEHGLVSLDEDRDGLDGKGSLHLSDVVGGHRARSLDLDGGSRRGVVSASAGGLGGARNIAIDRLKLSVVFLEVLEGPEGVATVAAHVGESGAIDELLLRE